eukprot:scaffold439_cov415-Prasinococcus_capsulatus_cf.AAC.28
MPRRRREGRRLLAPVGAYPKANKSRCRELRALVPTRVGQGQQLTRSLPSRKSHESCAVGNEQAGRRYKGHCVEAHGVYNETAGAVSTSVPVNGAAGLAMHDLLAAE